METVKGLCQRFPGETPVYVKLKDEGIALLLSREYWCSAADALLEAFRARYGADGVVVKA